jgi:hypothetical protein
MSHPPHASALPSRAFQENAMVLVGWQDRYTIAWHRRAPAAPTTLTGLERLVVEQHLTNFELWHAEDSARSPSASDDELARIKRFIDTTNQRRNDLAEQCDSLLLAALSAHGLPSLGAELHSESPGLMIDRLSILSLKLFHTRQEIERTGAPAGHTEANRERLLMLTEQREDLAGALDRLWHQVLAGQRRFKIYRQLKMYNDPALNPAVYAKQSPP